jgi:hypothetical protein
MIHSTPQQKRGPGDLTPSPANQTCSGNFWLQETIIAVSAAIDEIDGSFLRVVKQEKIVLQKLHLLNGLLGTHWIHFEALHPYDLTNPRFPHVLRQFLNVDFTAPNPLLAFAFVPLDLAVEFVNPGIDGSKNVVGTRLGAQNGPPTDHSKLGYLAICIRARVFDGQVHAHLIDRAQVAIKTLNLFFHIIFQP